MYCVYSPASHPHLRPSPPISDHHHQLRPPTPTNSGHHHLRPTNSGHHHHHHPTPAITIPNSGHHITIENLSCCNLEEQFINSFVVENKKVRGWIFGFLAGALAGCVTGLICSLLFKTLVAIIKGGKHKSGLEIFSQSIKKSDLAFLEKEDGLESLQIIGRGGCGEVYRAELPNCNIKTIAIKKIIEPSKDTTTDLNVEDSRLLGKKMRQIRSEIRTVGKIRHKNLVSLLAHLCRPDCHRWRERERERSEQLRERSNSSSSSSEQFIGWWPEMGWPELGVVFFIRWWPEIAGDGGGVLHCVERDDQERDNRYYLLFIYLLFILFIILFTIMQAFFCSFFW